MPSGGGGGMGVKARLRACLWHHLAQPYDDPHDVDCKGVILLSLTFQVILNTGLMLSGKDLFRTTVGATFAVGALVELAVLLMTRELSPGLLRSAVLLATVNITLADLGLLANLWRLWPLFVVVVDVLLYVRAPQWMSVAVVMWGVAYILLVEAELWLRFGLLDLPIFPDYEARGRRFQCEKPPCAASFAVSFGQAVPQITVLMLDFVFTRGFARNVGQDNERIVAAVSVANAVARNLAEFDIDTARETLATNSDSVPEQLAESFLMVLARLEAFTAYIPQACLLPTSAAREPAKPRDSEIAMYVKEQSRAKRRMLHGGSDMSAGDADSICSSESSSDYFCDGDSEGRPSFSRPPASPVSTSSVASSPPESPVVALSVINPPPMLHQRTVTLLSVTAHFPNSSQSLDPTYFTVRHEHVLSIAIDCISARTGVVDGFHGCRIAASFGAHRASPAPAPLACASARTFVEEIKTALPDILATGAVVAGPAVVGILGNSLMRRPAILGPLPALLPQMERYGAIRHYDWLCDQQVCRKCSGAHPMRVVLDSVSFEPQKENGLSDLEVSTAEPRPGHNQKLMLYELLMMQDPPDRAQLNVYNEAGRRYINQGSDAAYAFLHKHDASPLTWSVFREAVRASCVVDFAAHVRRKEELYIDSPRHHRRSGNRLPSLTSAHPVSSRRAPSVPSSPIRPEPRPADPSDPTRRSSAPVGGQPRRGEPSWET